MKIKDINYLHPSPEWGWVQREFVHLSQTPSAYPSSSYIIWQSVLFHSFVYVKNYVCWTTTTTTRDRDDEDCWATHKIVHKLMHKNYVLKNEFVCDAKGIFHLFPLPCLSILQPFIICLEPLQSSSSSTLMMAFIFSFSTWKFFCLFHCCIGILFIRGLNG